MYDLNPLSGGYMDAHRHSMSPDEQKEKVALAQRGDKAARDALVTDNLRLVASAAGAFELCGVDFDDIFQEGCMALMNAIDLYRPMYNRCFSTYAYDKIRWGISRAVIKTGYAIRAPLHIKELYYIIMRLRPGLACELGKEATIAELAAKTGTSEKNVKLALQSGESMLSLEYEMREPDGISFMELIPDDSIPCIEETVIRNHLEETVRDAVWTFLDDREYKIIQHRYGFDNCEIEPLYRIGEWLGISGERVRQIEEIAKNKIRSELKRRGVSEGSLF